jgi:hypothetical protein
MELLEPIIERLSKKVVLDLKSFMAKRFVKAPLVVGNGLPLANAKSTLQL